MCREKDGIIYGVLADFDLAVYTIRAGPSSKQRTGTRPFMAIDLLEKDPPQHMYRHDLESIAYVFFWIILRYDNGSQIPKPPLQEWWTFRGHHLADVKRSFLHRPFLTVPSAYSGFQTWAVKLWWLLHDGYAAQTHYVMDCITGISNASYDMQTLGGYVSFDKFAEVFDSDVA
jgi:hypothetical protein